MTPDELLQRHPRATLRWLRGRLGLSRLALAARIGVSVESVGHWEDGRTRLAVRHHRPLALLLAPELATPEGRAWLATLGEDA